MAGPRRPLTRDLSQFIFILMKSWERQDIEALAHALWERQGCPEGRALEHWREAEELMRAKWLADKDGEEHQVRDLRAQPRRLA
jgi:hypothetical protein